MKYKIVEAHWSIDSCDSHSPDDEDCTYLIEDHEGNPISGLFSKQIDAERFIKELNV